ncbi:hypothetical protein, partial [Agrococcus jejuensis]|uniref:hypothetical protein n=1 Tax=Agrococcus jejuensis TaxID=399736 RepID=UPI0034D971FF
MLHIPYAYLYPIILLTTVLAPFPLTNNLFTLSLLLLFHLLPRYPPPLLTPLTHHPAHLLTPPT